MNTSYIYLVDFHDENGLSCNAPTAYANYADALEEYNRVRKFREANGDTVTEYMNAEGDGWHERKSVVITNAGLRHLSLTTRFFYK